MSGDWGKDISNRELLRTGLGLGFCTNRITTKTKREASNSKKKGPQKKKKEAKKKMWSPGENTQRTSLPQSHD